MNIINIIIILLCFVNIYIIIEFNKYDIISSWNDIKTEIKGFIIINFVLTILLAVYLFLYVSKQTLNNSILLFCSLTLITILSIINLIISTNPYNLQDPNAVIKWIYGIQLIVYGFLIILYNKYLLINGSLYELIKYSNENDIYDSSKCYSQNYSTQNNDSILEKINNIINN